MKTQLCHLQLNFILQTAHLVRKLREIKDNCSHNSNRLENQEAKSTVQNRAINSVSSLTSLSSTHLVQYSTVL